MTSIATVNARTCSPYIYVDDDNIEGPWDGTYEHPFQFIQNGIDAAAEGDTVFVFSGIYNERINIEKPIRIIGENVDTTSIGKNASSTIGVVHIASDHVYIRGFTIDASQGLLGYGTSGIVLENGSCDNTISGNKIINPYPQFNYLIYLKRDCNNNIITGNECSGTYCGIYLSYNSCNNIISHNYITKTGGQGICLCLHSNNNYIFGNNITNSFNRGIKMVDVKDNIIKENSITHNAGPGIGIIGIAGSGRNIINNNIIKYNNYGVLLAGARNNIISGNDISNNRIGINLTLVSFGNIISRNDIKHNSCYGTLSAKFCIANHFYHNNFASNFQENAYDEGINLWYKATLCEGNYWDDYMGEDNDGDGIGDTPYFIPGGNNKDRYPLMEPYENSNNYNQASSQSSQQSTTATVTSGQSSPSVENQEQSLPSSSPSSSPTNS